MYKIYLPDGTQKEYDKDTTLLDIAKEYQHLYKSTILSGILNGEEKDLQNKIVDNAHIEFIEFLSPIGIRVYSASLVMVLYTAMLESLPGIPKLFVKSAFANNIYCDIESSNALPPNYIDIIKTSMQKIIADNTPIIYQRVSRVIAEKMFKSAGDYDRLGNIEQLDPERGTISSYTCKGVPAYFFSSMVPHAGYLKSFDLIEYHGRVLLRHPKMDDINKVDEFVDQPKLTEVLAEAEKWGKLIGCSTINKLNRVIETRKIKDLVRIAEALHEKKIAQIADKITENIDKTKLILIAGPSSSGKTTFAQRLKIQLQVNGIVPASISFDDYFLERDECPRKPNGDFDFESVYALDLKLLNNHLQKILAGETVKIPTFNFVSGSKEYRGRKIKLNPGQPLLMEGIHGLNDILTEIVPSEQKMKIYIAPFTQLRMDSHNLVEKTEIRMLRRIVRDSRFRAYNAESTIKQWENIREGEEKYIKPFQEDADIMFNTSLIYELAVLKKHAEPLLKQIDNTKKEYLVARRLLNLLEYVDSIDDELIPPNSIIREFIGDSWFH